MAGLLCLNDLTRRERMPLINIPDDVWVDAVSFGGQQVAPHVGEQQGTQDLEAIDWAREVWRRTFHRGAHRAKTLNRRLTERRHLRVHTPQAKIGAKADPAWRFTLMHGGLEAADWRRPRERI